MNSFLFRIHTKGKRWLCISVVRKNVDDTGPLILKKKRRYFDLKLFRQHLRRQKIEEIEKEKRELMKQCVKEPPENWTVRTFLEKINIGENIDEIEKAFTSWSHFVNITPKELYEMESMTNEQRRKIWKYVNQFNYGLYPYDGFDDFVKNFQAPPLKNENKEWSPEDIEQLKYYLEYYDVGFGDPWIYISWKMQRTFEEVQNKYVDLILKPLNKKRRCEICLTKSTTPLLMNRKFKLDPPFLFLIPSSKNFPPFTIFDFYNINTNLRNENKRTNLKELEENEETKKDRSQKKLKEISNENQEIKSELTEEELKKDPLYPSYGSFIFSSSFIRYVHKECF